jgi:hypothetical protein
LTPMPRPISELKRGHRDSEALQHLIEQATFLPTSTFLRAKGDQEMIGRELPDRVLEGKQRIIGSHGATRLDAHVVEVAEHGVKTFVRLLPRCVSSRRQPVEATGQGRRDDEDVLGRVYQRPDARGKLVRSGGGFSRCYQEPQSHESRRLPRGRRWAGAGAVTGS